MKADFQLRMRVWLYEQSYVQHLTLCGEARPERTSASLECDYYKLIHVIVTWEPMYSLFVCI